MTLFEKEIPDILASIYMNTKQNIQDGYSYDCLADMFNDWISPQLESLPEGWINDIKTGLYAEKVLEAMAFVSSFKKLLKEEK